MNMSKYDYTRRHFLKTIGLSTAAFAVQSSKGSLKLFANENTDKKPNIVFILVDDLGWIDTGCYGSKYYETPNIDKLAAEGMRFTDAYAACAVCSPTRAAVMTGRYPARLGVTDWIRARFQGGIIPENKKNPTEYIGGKNKKLLCPPNALWMELEEITIAEALKPVGYTSCHIGKWHLGADDWYPDRQGFDFNVGGCDFGQPPHYFDPYFRKGQGSIPTLEPRRKGEYLTDREADEAVKFIHNHKDKPFFLYMAHYTVHTPIQAKEDLIEKYKAKPPTNQKNPTYAAMVESLDDAVGRICSALDELDLAENTIIFFTSDNGGLLGPTNNAPLRSGKGFPYEGGIR
jgi:arylsulfatase A-like enzyme